MTVHSIAPRSALSPEFEWGDCSDCHENPKLTRDVWTNLWFLCSGRERTRYDDRIFCRYFSSGGGCCRRFRGACCAGATGSGMVTDGRPLSIDACRRGPGNHGHGQRAGNVASWRLRLVRADLIRDGVRRAAMAGRCNAHWRDHADCGMALGGLDIPPRLKAASQTVSVYITVFHASQLCLAITIPRR